MMVLRAAEIEMERKSLKKDRSIDCGFVDWILYNAGHRYNGVEALATYI